MMFRRFLPAAALFLLPAMAMAAQPAATQPQAGQANPTASLAHTPRDPGPEQVEAHIKALHDELRITKKQEALWTPFAEDMRANGQRLHDAIEARREKLPQLNAVENMQSYAELVEERAHDMQTLNSAFAALYDSFSKKQRKNADTLFKQGDAEHAEQQQARAAAQQDAAAPAAQ
ncbi:Spy/CpxP family protein refolding chaperone [Komagataeibacter sp. FNDCF1]|uniref:Spy/CpxP family protein refolding chaperone n=1 Tax=Komagataeibacter sp. FNDCF1 TaxID=2878681 RepID=UPI001E608F9B|nr:Spy/CpxP family protein refolding chaperone [Komagataeibacter sp. FNDCF1]MCE2565514.1 Spy/CpxP family protein refolding chaperone [Komagataeibacter sp. FNDCF1]